MRRLNEWLEKMVVLAARGVPHGELLEAGTTYLI
jgi:hypothetical protein